MDSDNKYKMIKNKNMMMNNNMMKNKEKFKFIKSLCRTYYVDKKGKGVKTIFLQAAPPAISDEKKSQSRCDFMVNSLASQRRTDLAPNIFLKKINVDNVKTIPLKTPNTLGHIRYFPPATKEWSSSIYAHYKDNYIKSLPIVDKNVGKLIKSYFNFYHISENWKPQRRILRIRRGSLYRVFVSKAEFKHTNSKVTIFIDVYDLQTRMLDLICWKLNNSRGWSIHFHLVNSYYLNLQDLYGLLKTREYIPRLIKVLNKIYDFQNKELEIHIVNLKYMYLNSDILTQAIALKLKDRNNRVWRVLRSCLGMVKLPYTNKYKEKSKGYRGLSLVDKVKKFDLKSLTSYTREKGGLLGIFPTIPSFSWKERMTVGDVCKAWYFYSKNYLRNKAVNGVRLEAKGRLTRRFKAQRAVFKLTWKGGLKNIDSSYKGFPAVILRGHVKSNVQYTFAKSKNRIGAYGVKGWVSGK